MGTTKPDSGTDSRRADQDSSEARTLDQELETLEQKWFAILQAEFSDRPLPTSTGGEIQFFSTDFPRTCVAPRDESADLPDASGSAFCVVCVGISHNAYRDCVEGSKVASHIFTRSRGQTSTVDLARTRATRRALNTALTAYAMNRNVWAENGYASDASLLPSNWDGREADLPLVVIKAYLSPFVSAKPWAEYSGTVRKETLHAWNPNLHLCDLIGRIGKTVDLWVIYGPPVWPHFDATSKLISKWLLTPTLSFESVRNGSITTFWKTRRRDYDPIQPVFPLCEGIYKEIRN